MSRNDFDRLFDRLDSLTVGFGPLFREFRQESSGYPPHNIYKSSDNGFTVELAVAGFKRDEVKLSELNGEVTIQGVKLNSDAAADAENYQYRGIATRDFLKRFKVAEYYEIDDACMEDGLLTVKFVRNDPEPVNPRFYKIN